MGDSSEHRMGAGAKVIGTRSPCCFKCTSSIARAPSGGRPKRWSRRCAGRAASSSAGSTRRGGRRRCGRQGPRFPAAGTPAGQRALTGRRAYSRNVSAEPAELARAPADYVIAGSNGSAGVAILTGAWVRLRYLGERHAGVRHEPLPAFLCAGGRCACSDCHGADGVSHGRARPGQSQSGFVPLLRHHTIRRGEPRKFRSSQRVAKELPPPLDC
jgi:hypothetical protein